MIIGFAQPLLAAQETLDLNLPSGLRAVFSAPGYFLPAQVEFLPDGRPLSVRVAEVRPVPDQAAGPARYETSDSAGERSVTTFIKPVSGRDYQVSTVMSESTPVPSLILTASLEDGRGLFFKITGADRLVYLEGDKFAVARTGDLKNGFRIGGGKLVLQNSANQDGLSVAVSGGDIEVTAAEESLIVKIIGRGQDAGTSIAVTAFRGDSLLALEKLPGPPAGTGGPAESSIGAVSSNRATEALEKGLDRDIDAVEFWPDRGRVFKPLRADPREAIFRLGFMWDKEGDSYQDYVLGGDLGLLYIGLGDREKLSLTARGLFTARFQYNSDSYDLQNGDFIGGPALGYQKGDDSFELFLYHQSSHLGDEVLESGKRRRIDYAREAIRLMYAHEWGNLRVYAGPTFNLHALPRDIEHKFTAQAGAEYRFSVLGQPAYVATDLQSRQENDWSVNTSFQVGLELGDPGRTKNRQWVFTEFFQGYSNMGQYWDRWESYSLIGVGYQWR